ncbi:hypothetical protein K523DRAFT_249653 [Schizophyllum commune Tattone D]|nr:hypothetical protein K523DRAFT_249653 [Schizophyllum commune Tattone D]
MPPKKRAGPSTKAPNSRKKFKSSDGQATERPPSPSPSPSPPRSSSASPPPSSQAEDIPTPLDVLQLSMSARVQSREHAKEALQKHYVLKSKELTDNGILDRPGQDPIRQLTAPCAVLDRRNKPMLVYLPNLLDEVMLKHVNEDSMKAARFPPSSDVFTAEKLVETVDYEWVPEQLESFELLSNASIVGQSLNSALLEIDEPQALEIMDTAQKIMVDYPATKALFQHDRCWFNSFVYFFKPGGMGSLPAPPIPSRAWRFLVVSGEFSKGEIYSSKLMAKMTLRPGHVIAFRGNADWRVSSSEGFRALALYYTSTTVWDLCGVDCS